MNNHFDTDRTEEFQSLKEKMEELQNQVNSLQQKVKSKEFRN
jgi:polyhydroxyalkanoate synthesis regulator phasin